NLALTFIDTLLSSQRTRTHHHHQQHTPADPGQLSQSIRSTTPAQTSEPNQKNRDEAQPYKPL
ncbi:MAG: hypothetical protein WAW17_08680, partial [Rhodococcus sp. (in: high G+C Gram-positive bacteria)]|uniref:hypothetical protein n=1 Tax=Rhodococcus sp. TaxID=1831 RepID=UPI003BAFA5F7